MSRIYKILRSVVPLFALLLSACLGGGGGSTPAASGTTPGSSTAATYTVSGTVSGLSGTGLVLQNNGADDKAISADGAFTFATPVADGANYSVTVKTQPGAPAQTCTVNNGTGTIAGANIGNIAVVCATNSYTVGGTVSGLSGTGLVLQNNGADDKAISANGAFTFFAPVADGANYSVTVKTQPGAPAQTCTVNNGTGPVSGANIGNITVVCAINSYTVGGTVSGLSGTGLVLQNNGADDKTISADSAFTFATPVADGANYTVTVKTQPGAPAQTCTVNNGTGLVSGANIGNITVICATNSYTVGGTVSGLSGTGLVLQNNGADDKAISADGAFTFATPVAYGAAYAVTVLTQPGGQECMVSNGNGAATADVGTVAVGCVAAWAGTRQLGVAGAFITDSFVATDANGNVYVAGDIAGGLDGNMLVGNNDLFVTKYNRSGIKQYTRQLGAANVWVGGYSVATDPSGNVYVAGETDGGLDGNTLTGVHDLYVTKFDSNGVKQYTRQLGAAGAWTVAYDVVADANGNVYVTGQTNGGLDGNTLTGNNDLFFTKYDSAGVKQYTRQLGVAGASAKGSSIATDASGNVYVTGDTSGGLDGNPLVGGTDGFITKYNSNGIKQYTRQFGVAAGGTAGYAVATDTNGNVYVTGMTGSGTASGLDGNVQAGVFDLFVIKYDSVGIKQYTRQLGVVGANTSAYGISVDVGGNVYVAGNTTGGLDGNTLMGFSDLFVTKYDSSGVKQYTRQLGAANVNTAGMSVATDVNGNAFVAGNVNGGLDGNTLTGSRDMFVIKYNSSGVKQ